MVFDQSERHSESYLDHKRICFFLGNSSKNKHEAEILKRIMMTLCDENL